MFSWRRPDGTGFLCSGIADYIDAADIAKLRSRFGDDAIAVAALPFSGIVPLVVPAEVTWFDAAGAGTTLTFGESSAWLEPPLATHSMPRVPRRFVVEAAQDLNTWDSAVASALAAIDSRELDKVVLAREVVVEADTKFDIRAVLDRLTTTQPGCYVYAHDNFVGASPELLVQRDGETVMSRPMAGTTPRRDQPEADEQAIKELQASSKDDFEHRLVVESVRGALAPHTTQLEVGDPQPERFTSVTHLTTTIRAKIADSGLSALDLALLLHPTPAVAGSPLKSALSTISRLEPFERGLYGGPVGWVDANGDGEFAVALRCADISGNKARLLVGAGIVAGSDPDLEWAETQAKLEPMLRCLVRP